MARGLSLRATIITLTLGAMLAPLNSTMIAVALPDVLREFDRSLALGSWIVISYLMVMAAMQPLAGSLGDRYGQRRLFIIGLITFLGATVLAALAWRIEVLMLARVIQALGGAIAAPSASAMVRSLVPADQQGQVYGVVGAGISIAAGLGPPIGGVITYALGWRWMFGANLLVILPALLLAPRLPAIRAKDAGGRFDITGSGLLILTLASTMLALTIWRVQGVPIIAVPVLGLVAVLGGALLVRHLRHAATPAINPDLFRISAFRAAGFSVLFRNLAMYTTMLSLPIFLTEHKQWGSAWIGWLLAGLSLQMTICSPLGGWLSDRIGRRIPAMVGDTVTTLAVVPLLAVSPSWHWVGFLGVLLTMGVGIGIASAPTRVTAVEVAPEGEAGQASGLFSTMRYLGSTVGSAGMAAILGGTAPAVGDFRLLYVLIGLAAGLAVVASARLPGR